MIDVPAAYRDATRIYHRLVTYRQTPEEVDEARRVIADAGLAGTPEPERAAGIVRWVHGHMRPGVSLGRLGTATSVWGALEHGVGNCVAHSAIGCFLLRANDLPARLVRELNYTRFALSRLPLVFTGQPIGPYLNSHVWLEVLVEGRWLPADAQLGLFGPREWVAGRLARGTTLHAHVGPIPFSEHWPFPLCIGVVEEGPEPEDRTAAYLIEAVGRFADRNSADWRVWEEGVTHITNRFDWSTRFAGLRILREVPRLRRMERALRGLLAHIDAESATGEHR
jgi:hypothetical protein